jgi:hypothetical protein
MTTELNPLEKTYKLGKSGMRKKNVKRIQEWLSLHGFGLIADGDFGSATDFAVREFQTKKRLADDGIVGPKTFTALTQPMRDALAQVNPSRNLGRMVVAYAKQHLKAQPRELGGKNMGPWVRLYMNGHEGPDFPWCAGFVSFILQQACDTMGVPMPLTPTYSCDILARDGQAEGRFLKESRVDHSKIKPGTIFLRRKVDRDWTHTGIVIKAEADVFMTIEGNTNDVGSREGYEVCQRFQGYRKKDFVRI